MRGNLERVFWLSFLAASLLLFPAVASGQTSGVRPLITQPVNESKLTVLKGNTYPLARPQYDHGPAPASLPMDRMMLVLKRSPEQVAALSDLLNQQQEKNSPSYHQWLTPAQFGQQFGLADQDIQTIVAWLQSHGFQVESVARGRGVIEFSGTAGEVQQTFHTAIHKYLVKGKAHWANASDPEIPTALAPAVAGIASLNNFPRKPMHVVAGIFQLSKGTSEMTPVQPTYDFGCGTSTCYGLGPYDFATIYNVLPLWNAGIDGTGQTIAVVGESDINLQDVDEFRSMFGLPAANLKIIHDGPDPGTLMDSGDETESDLDVEWAGAVAKGATIDFVVSESTEASPGVDLSAEYIVDHDLAPVMSVSYGECELDLGTAGNQFYDQLWQQASAEGITVLVAAGDGGSAVCDQGNKGATHGLSVNGLASTPYDVAVGGTDFNDALDPATYWNSTNNSTTQESAKGYIPEISWNDTCTSSEVAQLLGGSTDAETNCNDSDLTSLLQVAGGSGGASNCTTSTGSVASCSGGYAKPSWQSGTGVPSDGKRDLPDVSLFAGDGFNGNATIICQTDYLVAAGFPGVCEVGGVVESLGGTSVAAPAFAGIMALVNQATQARQGNANYVSYPLAAKSGASCDSSGTVTGSCIFYDTTFGTNAMPCVTGSPDCGTNTAGDSYGVLSGYGTTAGYDPATGLGSVNVANLVSNWTSVSFQPSTTTLTLNGGGAVDITHGTPVSVNVSVSPASPKPTGLVSLIATVNGNTFDAGTFTLNNGAVSGSTTLLPGGTSYSVVAHYAGDGTYAASDSQPVTVTVNPESSRTFANLVTFDTNGNLTSYSATSATYGSGYYQFRVDVGDSAATFSPTTGISSTCSNLTASCPTGAVSVTNNGTTIAGGSLPLNAQGYAEDQALPGGTYAVTATYPGDSSYGPSMGTGNFTITKAPTVVTIASPSATVPYGLYGDGLRAGGDVEAVISTKSDGVAPTGTFSFSLDGSPLAVSDWVYGGGAFYPPSRYAYYYGVGKAAFLSLGSHTLTVQYSGDGYYAPSTSAPLALTVTQAQPFFQNFQANPSTVQLSQPVTVTTTMCGSEAGVAPTGTITFYDNNAPVPGTGTYVSGGPTASQCSYLQESMVWTPTTIGGHTITAQYSGDEYYLPATSLITAYTDALVSTTLSLASSSPTFQFGKDVTLTAQVTPAQTGGPAPTGMVRFTGNGALIGNASLNSSGEAQVTTNSLQGDTVKVGAVYSGDVDYDGSTGSITLTSAPDFALSTSPNPPNVTISKPGSSGSATLTVTSEGGFAGTVSFALACPASGEIKCSISPTSVDLTSSTTAASTTLTVNTTAPSLLPPAGEPMGPGSPGTATELTFFAIFCLAVLLRWLRKPKRHWSPAFAFLLLVSVLALASCGGGGSSGAGGGGSSPPSNPGTPVGSYSVTVTAKSGSLSHSTTVTFAVQ